jgi:hypothetical protein
MQGRSCATLRGSPKTQGNALRLPCHPRREPRQNSLNFAPRDFLQPCALSLRYPRRRTEGPRPGQPDKLLPKPEDGAYPCRQKAARSNCRRCTCTNMTLKCWMENECSTPSSINRTIFDKSVPKNWRDVTFVSMFHTGFNHPGFRKHNFAGRNSHRLDDPAQARGLSPPERPGARAARKRCVSTLPYSSTLARAQITDVRAARIHHEDQPPLNGNDSYPGARRAAKNSAYGCCGR